MYVVRSLTETLLEPDKASYNIRGRRRTDATETDQQQHFAVCGAKFSSLLPQTSDANSYISTAFQGRAIMREAHNGCRLGRGELCLNLRT
jgi:hypothetical protein